RRDFPPQRANSTSQPAAGATQRTPSGPCGGGGGASRGRRPVLVGVTEPPGAHRRLHGVVAGAHGAHHRVPWGDGGASRGGGAPHGTPSARTSGPSWGPPAVSRWGLVLRACGEGGLGRGVVAGAGRDPRGVACGES